MMTAAVRDLHRARPGEFQTAVDTSCPAIWDFNPYISTFAPGDSSIEQIEMNYPLIHTSNQRPYHFIHGYVQYLEDILDIRIPVTEFKGDIYLSEEEKGWMSQIAESGYTGGFWIIIAGGKYDFTTKWWNPASFQKVIDHFAERIVFVQCGELHHWHPPLRNVFNLIGKTDLRQFIRLVYHADGIVCPVTLAMHLAASVETRPGAPRSRPCVVVAGGREPPHWEAYPNHQFISNTGALNCCQMGGCWKSYCQLATGSEIDHGSVCEHPVDISPGLRIPQCMQLISADDVIRRIEMYYQGGALEYLDESGAARLN
jgi:ADP-heptose:LPS heptosyltransferase